MSNIYEKLIEERNSIREKDSAGFGLEILSQLMVLAFENDSEPDELPKTFRINEVIYTKEMLESMLERLDIDANVEYISSGLGLSYQVTQK